MGFSFDAPGGDQLNGDDGNRIGEPGTFHLVITSVKEGEGPSGKPIDGFTFEADVLGGTVEGCAGKAHRETLFAPNLSGSDAAQAMARKKLAAFFIATGVMIPDQLGKSVDIDVDKAIGKQLIVDLERQKDKDEKGKYTIPTKYVQTAYANIYHVDDPDVKDIPKNAEALGMRDDADKHGPEWFAFKAKKGAQPTPAAAGASGDQFDDL